MVTISPAEAAAWTIIDSLESDVRDELIKIVKWGEVTVAQVPVFVGSFIDSPWLPECLEAIRHHTDRPVDVFVGSPGSGYEPEALTEACNRYERFLFIQDSLIVHDRSFFDVVDSHDGDAWLAAQPSMYMGIHSAESLRPHLPDRPLNKEEVIVLESALHDVLHMGCLWPQASDHNALRIEAKHGRRNLVIGVEGVWEKWKGTWR